MMIERGLISQTYKFAHTTHTYNSISKTNHPIRKWAEDLHIFPKMAYSHMRRCSMSLLIREMHIKTIKYHFISVRVTISKTIYTNNKYWIGCGEKGTCIYCWEY